MWHLRNEWSDDKEGVRRKEMASWNSLMEEEMSPPSISKQEKPPAVFIHSLVFLFGRKLKDKSKQKKVQM